MFSGGSAPDHRALHDHCPQKLLVYHHEGITVNWRRTLLGSSTVLCDCAHPGALGILSAVLPKSCTEGLRHLF